MVDVKTRRMKSEKYICATVKDLNDAQMKAFIDYLLQLKAPDICAPVPPGDRSALQQSG